jgi:hypothetical protein
MYLDLQRIALSSLPSILDLRCPAWVGWVGGMVVVVVAGALHCWGVGVGDSVCDRNGWSLQAHTTAC